MNMKGGVMFLLESELTHGPLSLFCLPSHDKVAKAIDIALTFPGHSDFKEGKDQDQ